MLEGNGHSKDDGVLKGGKNCTLKRGRLGFRGRKLGTLVGEGAKKVKELALKHYKPETQNSVLKQGHCDSKIK